MTTADLIARLECTQAYLRDETDLPTPDYVVINSTAEFSYHLSGKDVAEQVSIIRALVEKYGHNGWELFTRSVDFRLELSPPTHIRVYFPASPETDVARELLAAGWRAANEIMQ